MKKIIDFILKNFILFIFSCFFIFLMTIIILDLKIGLINKMTTNSSYYLFSSAAQTIAAFIALLIAGYVFALSAMERIEDKDPTYAEVWQIFKRKYYNYLILLGLITSFAILMNFLSVLLVEKVFFNILFYYLTIILTMISVLGGILFIIIVLDPDKFIKAADSKKKEVSNAFKDDTTYVSEDKPKKFRPIKTSRERFINDFIKLEAMIRNYLRKKQFLPPKIHKSVSQMSDDLLKMEIISIETYNRLRLVSEFRNLVVHGEINTIDEEIGRDLRRLRTEVGKELKTKYYQA